MNKLSFFFGIIFVSCCPDQNDCCMNSTSSTSTDTSTLGMSQTSIPTSETPTETISSDLPNKANPFEFCLKNEDCEMGFCEIVFEGQGFCTSLCKPAEGMTCEPNICVNNEFCAISCTSDEDCPSDKRCVFHQDQLICIPKI